MGIQLKKSYLKPLQGFLIIIFSLSVLIAGSSQTIDSKLVSNVENMDVNKSVDYDAGDSAIKKDLGVITKKVNDVFFRIELLSEKIVRVVTSLDENHLENESLVLIKAPAMLEFEVVEYEGFTDIETSFLKVSLDHYSGEITYSNTYREQILKAGKVSPDNFKKEVVDSSNIFNIKQTFILQDDEGIFGLGQYQDGYMNYRNKDVTLIQTNTAAVNPFLTSTNNYGILWNNYSHTEFHDGKDGTYFKSTGSGVIDYCFVAGENMDDVIGGYRAITGIAPMFGKWAYGYWQSKERYTSFKELKNIVTEHRNRKLPLDAIVQDWQYWGDNTHWSSMKFSAAGFENAKENIDQLHDLNVKLMVSIWPSIGPETAIYKDLKSKNHLFDQQHWSTGAVYDAYSEEARSIYWKHIKNGLIDKGVDALWMDGTEPEFQDCHNPQDMKKAFESANDSELGPTSKYLNAFSLMTTKGVYEHHRKYTNDKRVFILTRSAFSGQQRHAAVTWSGDISANWDVLRKQISSGTNFSMSGIPYWTMDIGAFFPSGGGCKDPSYRELYTRWFQFGAFCPIFRAHGTGTPREIWQFGNEDSEFYQSMKKFNYLRYRMMPYIYSLAWRITNGGYTIMRGLAMDFPGDKNGYNVDNQYMFGPAFLVSPVTQEMYYAEKKLGEVIGGEYLRTEDGKSGGLTAKYYSGINKDELKTTTVDSAIDFNWGGNPPSGLGKDNYSVSWTGEIVPDETGTHTFLTESDDGIRVVIDGKTVIENWTGHAPTVNFGEIDLEAGKSYTIQVDYFQGQFGALVKLTWQKPSYTSPKSLGKNNHAQTYLPAGISWYNFWTNEKVKGGQTISQEVPLDEMPLYIKAGSIIPFGPELQYSNEKPADPIELRIYPGADGQFVLYEDEGDNYNYENGVYATIPFTWIDAANTLVIGTREGTFPGMLKKRTFKIVKVSSNITKEVSYEGKTMTIDL